MTKRVQHLINLAHEGNVHEASKVSKVPSSTLRALFSGKNTNPSVETLRKLGEAYGIYPGWFTDPTMPEGMPLGGLNFLVRVPNPPHGMRVVREILIPWASWPLPEVFDAFSSYLLALPRTPERPIIGELGLEPEQATETQAKIALFLLAPLDAANGIAGTAVEVPVYLRETDGEMETEVQQLRMLGKFWQKALAPVLTKGS